MNSLNITQLESKEPKIFEFEKNQISKSSQSREYSIHPQKTFPVS